MNHLAEFQIQRTPPLNIRICLPPTLKRTNSQYESIIIHRVQRKPIEHAKETCFAHPTAHELPFESTHEEHSLLIEQK